MGIGRNRNWLVLVVAAWFAAAPFVSVLHLSSEPHVYCALHSGFEDVDESVDLAQHRHSADEEPPARSVPSENEHRTCAFDVILGKFFEENLSNCPAVQILPARTGQVSDFAQGIPAQLRQPLAAAPKQSPPSA